MNVGYEGQELKPFSEPPQDLNDLSRIGQSSPVQLDKPEPDPWFWSCKPCRASWCLWGCWFDA